MALTCSYIILLTQWLFFLSMVKKCMFCSSHYEEPPPRGVTANEGFNNTTEYIAGMPVLNMSLDDYIKKIEEIENESAENQYRDVDNEDAENPDLRGDLSNSSVWTENFIPLPDGEGITLEKYKEFMKEYNKRKKEGKQRPKSMNGRPGYWAPNGTWIGQGPGGFWKNGEWVPSVAGDGGYWDSDGKWVPGPDGGAGYWAPNGTWIPMPGEEGGHFDADGNWIVGPGGKGGGFWGIDGTWVPGPMAEGGGYYDEDGTWHGPPTKPPGVGHDWPEEWKDVGQEYIPETPPPYAYFSKSYGKPGMCFQPPKRGHCTKYHLRWGFNVYKQDCVEFVYSGCGGNLNNFLTKSRCREVCLNLPKSKCEDYPPELMPHDCFPNQDQAEWIHSVPFDLPYLKPPKKKSILNL